MRRQKNSFVYYFVLLIISGMTFAKQAESAAVQVLWSDPTSTALRPESLDISKDFTLVKEAKVPGEILLDDGEGRRWRALIERLVKRTDGSVVWTGGDKGRSEVAAACLLRRVGYQVPEFFWVRELRLWSPSSILLQRVRLQRVRTTEVDEGEWDWKLNPFADSRELQGLKVLLALLNFVDYQNRYNRMVYDASSPETVRYILTNLGRGLGSNGFFRSFGKAGDFLGSPFLRGMRGGFLVFRRGNPVLEGISRTDALWLADQVSKISAPDLGSCFFSAGFSTQETDRFVEEINLRIAALRALPQDTLRRH